ncbi:MAG: X2-like carbohydrate binding domain-containing protein [Dehalococcoidia bacterium]
MTRGFSGEKERLTRVFRVSFAVALVLSFSLLPLINDPATLAVRDTYAAGKALAVDDGVDLTITVSAHAPTITITAIELTCATVDPQAAEYDLSHPAAVETIITWNDASAVDSIMENGNTLVEGIHYTLGLWNGAATLSILDAYLADRLLEAADDVELTIAFDVCKPTTFAITAIFGEIPVQYDLTISSTTGGAVTEPGEETFAYDAGTVVDLVAEPDEGYGFFRWTGDVDTIADVGAASTGITMEGSYNITASFGTEIPLPLVNRPLIGGIIAAVIVAGLVVFLVRRRTGARAQRR